MAGVGEGGAVDSFLLPVLVLHGAVGLGPAINALLLNVHTAIRHQCWQDGVHAHLGHVLLQQHLPHW